MGHWDELCLVCGISPIPPQELWTDPSYEITDFVGQLLEFSPQLSASTSLAKDPEGLEEILLSALDVPPHGLAPFSDDSVWRWSGFTDCIAIGHFLEDGDVPQKILLDNKNAGEPGILFKREIPNGSGAQSRVVRVPDCGGFSVVVDQKSGEMVETEQLNGFGNFFLSEACFKYVQNWVDWENLPVSKWHSRQLNFQEELYEVINSRERGRGAIGRFSYSIIINFPIVNGVGTLAWMDYDDIENTLDQTQYTFSGGSRSCTNTIAAIEQNASLPLLHAAMIKDHRCWMFHAPDIWPRAAENRQSAKLLPVEVLAHLKPQISTSYHSSHGLTNGLTSLPIELFYEVLIQLPGLSGYFDVSATSKYFRSILCEPTFYSRVLRGMLTHRGSCLYWVLPLTSIGKEAEKAKDAMSSWIDADDRQTRVNWHQSSFVSQLIDPEFPLAAFVEACFSSDSMMNRKRIWGQVKQLEEVWRDYRSNGWKVDRFGVQL